METANDSPTKHHRASILLDDRFCLKPDQPPPPPPPQLSSPHRLNDNSKISNHHSHQSSSSSSSVALAKPEPQYTKSPLSDRDRTALIEEDKNSVAKSTHLDENEPSATRDEIHELDEDGTSGSAHRKSSTTLANQLSEYSAASSRGDNTPTVPSQLHHDLSTSRAKQLESSAPTIATNGPSISTAVSSSLAVDNVRTEDAKQEKTLSNEICSAPSLQSRFESLEKLMQSRPMFLGSNSINCEILVDLMNAVYYECHTNFSGLTRNKNQQKFLELIEPFVTQINSLRLQAKDFDLIKVIGFGNFGQVSVVKSREDNDAIYAMKTLNKAEMLRRAETACYREERDILLHGNDHDWFTKLHYAFQDEQNLYLIMDYYIGGDLLTLFSKYDDLLPEDMSRFYSAQIVMAISMLHGMGYIHRDIKPDNILLDRDGHARLADFGSCLKVSNIASDGICTIAVGTPDYISPDVLKAMEGDKKSGQLYDYDVDWWSLGVVIYESLFGETPFYAESLAETYSKIMNHELSFKFPEEPQVSDEAKDLISHLICCRSKRFHSLEQFKSHKWFDGIDWDNLRHVEPPYKPIVSGPDDTSNFDIDESRPSNLGDSKVNPVGGINRGKDSILNIHLPFVGYTATFTAGKLSNPTKFMEHTANRSDVIDGLSQKPTNRAIMKSGAITSAAIAGSDSVIQPSSSARSSNLHSSFDEDLNHVDIRQLESDLNLAREQWTELSILVNDIRKEKSALSSQLRSKENEIESQLEKITEMRNTIACLEKMKRQQSEEVGKISIDLEREKHINYNYQMEISNLESKLQTMQSELVVLKSREQMGINSHENVNQGAKDELISQQRDYIAHLEEQVLKLQQQQPNWDKQVAALKNLDPENIYMNSYQVDAHKHLEHGSNTTWQERRSAKAERNELKELQLSLQNELEDKRRIQNDLEDKKRELCQALADLAEIKIELTRQEQQKRMIGDSNVQNYGNGNRPLPFVSQSMLTFNPPPSQIGEPSEYLSQCDPGAQQLPNSPVMISASSSSYQQGSNLGMQSSYLHSGGYTSTEEGYSEAEAAYRQIRNQQQYSPSNAQPQPPLTPTRNHQQFQRSLTTMSQDRSRMYANMTELGPQPPAPHQTNPAQYQQQQQMIANMIQRNRGGNLISPPPINQQTNRHMFVVRTFIMPLKCHLCTSLMTGLIRQGLVCESCGFACHARCAKSLANLSCPYEDKRYVGLDPQRGIGTAYSGYVRIPRPGGIRKGWMRIHVVVCDFKLFLYELVGESLSSSSSMIGGSGGSHGALGGASGLGGGSSNVSLVGGANSSSRDDSLPMRNSSSGGGVSVARIIDLRDESFSVTSVLESDVIHASRTDISCIFRLSSSMIGDQKSSYSQRSVFHQLMLVDKESEKIKWIEALLELHRIIKRNNLPDRNILAAYLIMNASNLTQLRNLANVNCCAIIEEGPKILIGTDDSLICCYLDLQAYHRLPKGNKVLKLETLESEQLIVAMAGKQRHIKLIPLRALESDSVAWIKMPETKNATTFVIHNQNISGAFISVAVKKSLYVYEITRRQFRYAPWREIQSNAVIQTLNASGPLVCVGTCSNFHVHNIIRRDGPPLYLINAESNELMYITQNPLEPLGCYQILPDKWLLVFENHGIYVNSLGYKTQDPDLQFVTKCNTIASLLITHSDSDTTQDLNRNDNPNTYKDGSKLLILAFSNNHIDIYNSFDGEWLQTINLKGTKPLQSHAINVLPCITGALDLPQLVQISSKGNQNTQLTLSQQALTSNQQLVLKSSLIQKLTKEGSLEGNDLQRKISRLYISEPSDFKHLSHMGPANPPGLIDLNNISHGSASKKDSTNISNDDANSSTGDID